MGAVTVSHFQRTTSSIAICFRSHMVLKHKQVISAEVYNLAASKEPIGERVKEALDVIQDALDTFTCVPV